MSNTEVLPRSCIPEEKLSSERANLSNMPLDIIGLIWRYLHISDRASNTSSEAQLRSLIRLLGVCKHIRSMSPRFRNEGTVSLVPKSDQFLERIGSLVNYVEKLHISPSQAPLDSGWKHLSALSNLRELQVSHTCLQDIHISAWWKNLPLLRKLTLRSCKQITGVGLRGIEVCLDLEELNLEYCNKLDPTAMFLLKQLRVKKLSLIRCRVPVNRWSSLIEMESLKHLCVHGSDLKEQSAITEIAQLKKLQEITVHTCSYDLVKQLTEAIAPVKVNYVRKKQ